jgi:hypothetical protein
MFKILKWAVLGCIALAAVNAFTDGRLREKVEGTLHRLEGASEPVSLQRRIEAAKRSLERSEGDFAKRYQALVAEREELNELDEAIATLEQKQREQLARAQYLNERLDTQLTSFRELSGTYSRAEVEEQARASWRALEFQEELLARKRELRVAQLENVANVEKAVTEHLDRQHQARLEIVRAESKLAALRRDPRWSAVPGQKNDHLEKAEQATRKIRQELQVYEQTLHLTGAETSSPTPRVGPDAEAFRREMEARYGAGERQDT